MTHPSATRRLVTAAALLVMAAPLGGCDLFRDILNGLGRLVTEEPRFVYAYQTGDATSPAGAESHVIAAVITPEDKGFVFNEIDLGLPNGFFTGLTLSPDARRVGVTFVEDGFVIEAQVHVAALDSDAVEFFATDNTVLDDIRALCTDPPYLQAARAEWDDWITAGSVAPGTTPGIDYFGESPENEAVFGGWLSDLRFALNLRIEVGLAEVAADGTRVSFGPDEHIDLALTFQRRFGRWDAVSCDPPGPVVTRPSVRDLRVGTLAGRSGVLVLDGAEMVNAVGGGALVPRPVARLTGAWPRR